MLDAFIHDLVEYVVDNRCEIAIKFACGYFSGVLARLTVEYRSVFIRKLQQRLR